MKRFSKAMALFLASCLLFAGCSESGAGGEETDASEPAAPAQAEAGSAETEPAPEPSYLDTLEVRDFGGGTFTIIAQSTESRPNFYMEEKDGDVMNDAVRDRDLYTEDRLNITLECVGLDNRDQVAKDVQNVIQAGDEAYHLVFNSLSAGINTLTTGGFLLDLTSLPYLLLNSSHWNESMAKNMRFYGKQYFTTGPISLSYFITPTVMVYNKRLAEDFGITGLNDTVLEGKWTVDRLAELAAAVSSDTDGDGDMDSDDLWGLSMEGTFGNSLFMAGGLNTIEETDGEYRLTLDSEEAVNLVDKCASLFGDRTLFFDSLNGDPINIDIFREGRAVFLDCAISWVITMREMEDDFGILPPPKFTEEVPAYYTACNTWLPSGVGVPMICSDPDRTGLVMETMAAVSQELLTPAVYDVTLQGKVSRDEESAAMLDLIYANTAFDLNTILDFGGSSILLRACVLGEQENYVSAYAKIKKIADKNLQKFVAFAKGE
ncbi:MAG: extracellular solute-binding protein [Clostridia bacterium]|nr:extracellular solute-binding protein [Clostridia bacterium]